MSKPESFLNSPTSSDNEQDNESSPPDTAGTPKKKNSRTSDKVITPTNDKKKGKGKDALSPKKDLFPMTLDEIVASMEADGLYKAVVDALKQANDKNVVSLTTLILEALKTQPMSARHALTNNLLRDSRRDMMITETKKTRRDNKAYTQILFEFWMDFLHEKCSTKQKATTTASGDYNRIRGIDLMSKKIFDNLQSPSELNDFVRAVLIKTHTYPIWHKLLKLNVKGDKTNKKSTNYSILKDHRKLSDNLVTGYNFESSPELKDGSLSLYQALSMSISSRLRTMMVTHEDEIGLSGPKFLFFILKTLTDEITTLSREVTEEVQTLPATLKANSYDIPTIAPRLQTQLVALRNAGGNLTSMYDLIKSAFMDLNINELTSKLTTFSFKMDALAIDEGDVKGTRAILLLKQAPLMVKEVKAMKKWKWGIPTRASRKSNVQDSKDDVTSFNAIKTQVLSEVQSELKALYTNKQTNPFANKRKAMNSYRYGPHQWSTTNNRLVNNEAEFQQFRSGAFGKKKVSYNGVDWHWCSKCNNGNGRMGNHPTVEHRDKNPGERTNKRQATGTNGVPPCFAQTAKLPAVPEPPTSDTEGATDADEYDASDLE